MLPSISDDLSRVRATLERLAGDDSVPPAVGTELRSVERVVGLVQRSWARMIPYLVEDNRRLQAVLSDLAQVLPAPWPAEITAEGTAGDTVDEEVSDPEALAETNRSLRSILSRLIRESASAPSSVASEVNRRAASALRAGLGSRPW